MKGNSTEFETLVEEAQIQNLNITRGTEDKGLCVFVQLRAATGEPHAFQAYVPYRAPGNVDTEIEDAIDGLLNALTGGFTINVLQDIKGEALDGGLLIMMTGELADTEVAHLYGPCWQRIN